MNLILYLRARHVLNFQPGLFIVLACFWNGWFRFLIKHTLIHLGNIWWGVVRVPDSGPNAGRLPASLASIGMQLEDLNVVIKFVDFGKEKMAGLMKDIAQDRVDALTKEVEKADDIIASIPDIGCFIDILDLHD